MRSLEDEPPMSDPIYELMDRETEMVIKKEDYDFLTWFYHRADFGPADDEVRELLKEAYAIETGKAVPEGF